MSLIGGAASVATLRSWNVLRALAAGLLGSWAGIGRLLPQLGRSNRGLYRRVALVLRIRGAALRLYHGAVLLRLRTVLQCSQARPASAVRCIGQIGLGRQ